MDIVSVINYKGGVGKTTATANIAAELAYRGDDVLLIDVDAQASLTFSFIKPDYWEQTLSQNKTIKQLFGVDDDEKADLDDLIIYPEAMKRKLAASNNDGSLGLISSHLGLLNVDLELATELGAPSLEKGRRKFLKVHGVLHEALQSMESEFDIVLIDCPPNFNIVTKNAIVASDYVLIPAKPDYLSTLGIDYLIRHLNKLKKDYNDYVQSIEDDIDTIDPEILGVIFSMVSFYGGQPVSTLRQYIAQTKKLGVPVFDTYIRENKTIFSEAPEFGIPVSCNSYSNDTHNSVVSELKRLTDEFIAKVGL